jgi:hypothetical protein
MKKYSITHNFSMLWFELEMNEDAQLINLLNKVLVL